MASATGRSMTSVPWRRCRQAVVKKGREENSTTKLATIRLTQRSRPWYWLSMPWMSPACRAMANMPTCIMPRPATASLRNWLRYSSCICCRWLLAWKGRTR